jgi:hypothetical protein
MKLSLVVYICLHILILYFVSYLSRQAFQSRIMYLFLQLEKHYKFLYKNIRNNCRSLGSYV